MSKKKKTTTTNTYQYLTPPSTPATTQLQSMVQPVTPDPTIPYSFARQREDYGNSFLNPLGAYTSPAVREAANRIAGERLSQTQNVAQQASLAEAQQRAFGQQAAVAGMLQPQLVQSGGTTMQTIPFDWMSALGVGANVGIAAM